MLTVMSSITLRCFMLICCFLQAPYGFKFSCPSVQGSEQPPVINQTAYSLDVDISIDGKQETLHAYEFYSEDNGTLFLYVDFPDDKNGDIWTREKIVHDYNYNQTFVVDMNKKTCNVSDLMRNETYSIFGMGIENGFKSPKYSFKWKGNYNYSKSNTTTILDGVTAQKYNTCLTFDNDTIMYEVDLYFSIPEWQFRGMTNVPLLLLLKTNQTQDDGKTFTSQKYTFSFSSYHRDPYKEWIPELPHDMICSGRKDAVKFPGISTRCKVTSDLYDKEKKTIFSSRMFYDYDDKLYRFDFTPWKNSTHADMPDLPSHRHTVIHDFHLGVAYLIDKEQGNCTVAPINDTSFWDNYDVEPDHAHHGFFHMLNITDFDKKLNYVYTGRRISTSGIMLDSWTSDFMKINSSYGPVELKNTVFYTTVDWSKGVLSPVPISGIMQVKKNVNGTSKLTEKEYFYSDVTTKFEIHTYGVDLCYNNDTKKSFVLKFAKSYAVYLKSYSYALDDAIIRAVMKAANVSKTRVSVVVNKEIGTDAESDNTDVKENLFVSFTLFDKPKVNGSTTEMVPQVNLTTAVKNLKMCVQNNMFHVQFTVNKGKTVLMIAFPDYFKERQSLYAPPSPPSGHSQESKRLSNGAVAALCIGMAVFGFVVASAICHFRNKHGYRQLGYGIQD